MATTKNLCAQISLDLHQKISEAREAAGLTTAQYITELLTESGTTVKEALQQTDYDLPEVESHVRINKEILFQHIDLCASFEYSKQ